MSFVEKLMQTIIKGKNIPKVQVERMVSPIIEIFLEDILTTYYQGNSGMDDEYKLITPEFPLKKGGNYQSTNIDYLLFNEKHNFLVILEFKTDLSSFSNSQYKTYIDIQAKISQLGNAIFLFDDLNDIAKASSKKSKYQTLINSCNQKYFKNIQEIKIIYLVPKGMKSKIQQQNVDVITFHDLPKTLSNHLFVMEWNVIRDELKQL